MTTSASTLPSGPTVPPVSQRAPWKMSTTFTDNITAFIDRFFITDTFIDRIFIIATIIDRTIMEPTGIIGPTVMYAQVGAITTSTAADGLDRRVARGALKLPPTVHRTYRKEVGLPAQITP